VLPLTHVHVFPYSDRPGTAAASLPARVAGPDVRARGQAVRAVARHLSNAFQARQIGTERRALTVDDGTRAVTDNYLKIAIPDGVPRNEWVQVVIGGAPGALEGALTASRSL
jgi:threonylcarbamoyladenosine tRNA methylthiotransferase MtaB